MKSKLLSTTLLCGLLAFAFSESASAQRRSNKEPPSGGLSRGKCIVVTDRATGCPTGRMQVCAGSVEGRRTRTCLN
jgi:hypothetical protein